MGFSLSLLLYSGVRPAEVARLTDTDVCRHIFASFHAVHFPNLPESQLEMAPRDLSLLRSRYMAPAARKEARVFWQSCK